MKRYGNGMRIAGGLVAVFLLTGIAGMLQRPSEPPYYSVGNIAAFVAGSVFARVHPDFPATNPSNPVNGANRETLVLSEKGKSAGGQPGANGTSPGIVAQFVGMNTVPTSAEDELSVRTQEKTGGQGDRRLPGAAAEKKVFIYHSHNRESWLPELKGTGKDRPNEAFDDKKNVSLLGKRLMERLETKGVGAVHSKTDYNTAVKGFNYNYSYKYSNKTVREVMAVHHGLEFLLDVHRDSQRRKHTTVTIGGKDYAMLYFIIGQGNPNWEQNEALAQTIHEKMESKLPGVSKGILTKGTKHGHGEYNQSLSSGSVLIEIGGVDNTLEESYRTIDVLASVIAELVQESDNIKFAGRVGGTGKVGDHST